MVPLIYVGTRSKGYSSVEKWGRERGRGREGQRGREREAEVEGEMPRNQLKVNSSLHGGYSYACCPHFLAFQTLLSMSNFLE